MVAKIYNKNVIVICDCIDCRNRPTWIQGFMTKKGFVMVDLCEDHHYILRTKVPKDIPLDENVLKWLLMQEANSDRVVKYGIVNGSADTEFMRELDKIDIELE
jgi:hypothetical protein